MLCFSIFGFDHLTLSFLCLSAFGYYVFFCLRVFFSCLFVCFLFFVGGGGGNGLVVCFFSVIFDFVFFGFVSVCVCFCSIFSWGEQLSKKRKIPKKQNEKCTKNNTFKKCNECNCAHK